jgi:hypothetical protein
MFCALSAIQNMLMSFLPLVSLHFLYRHTSQAGKYAGNNILYGSININDSEEILHR